MDLLSLVVGFCSGVFLSGVILFALATAGEP